jgi:hypothetical protein
MASMVPEYRTAEVERRELATATASALEFSAASATADGSAETLFDFEESRDYDLGVGD